MKINKYRSLILFIGLIAPQNYFSHSSNLLSKDPEYYGVSGGVAVSRLGHALETSDLYGFGLCLDMYKRKAPGIAISGSVDIFYTERDFFRVKYI